MASVSKMENTAKPIFELIKKQNGEHFAQSIRQYDSGIFDIPDITKTLKYAGREATPLLAYLESLKKIEIISHGNYLNPIMLLHQAGYEAYYADTLEKQNAISRYFEPGEKQCTFDDATRFQKFHIINAVRKNAKQLNRAFFKGKERREDAYATSVLSIQILKTGGFISIKNRYNITVENPDNTFGSNPDKIIPGLTASLIKHLKVDFVSQNMDLPKGYFLLGNQILKYNYVQNGIYFGFDFYVKDGKLYPLDKDKEFMLDNCIINLKEKTIQTPVETGISLKKALEAAFLGKKLSLSKIGERGYKISTAQGAVVEVKDGCIVKLILPDTQTIGNKFMFETKHLTHLEMPQVKEIGLAFLGRNQSLRYLNLPRVKKIGGGCLAQNKHLQVLKLPQVEEVGFNFLKSNTSLKQKDTLLPQIKKMGPGSFGANSCLRSKFSPLIKRTIFKNQPIGPQRI